MRLIKSDTEGVYATVSTIDDTVKIQVLFSDISGAQDDGISIVDGGASSFDFFVFVPVAIFDTLVDIHSREVFDKALVRVCEFLITLPERDG